MRIYVFPFAVFAVLAAAVYVVSGDPINWVLVLAAGVVGAAVQRVL